MNTSRQGVSKWLWRHAAKRATRLQDRIYQSRDSRGRTNPASSNASVGVVSVTAKAEPGSRPNSALRRLSLPAACTVQGTRQTFLKLLRPGPNGTVERLNRTFTTVMAPCS
jgi:hypothetical protein